MCVCPSLSSGWNSSVQDSHCLILEEQRVVFRRGHQSIEMCWPGFSFRVVHMENASLPNEIQDQRPRELETMFEWSQNQA
jgi:hypothetical protein